MALRLCQVWRSVDTHENTHEHTWVVHMSENVLVLWLLSLGSWSGLQGIYGGC